MQLALIYYCQLCGSALLFKIYQVYTLERRDKDRIVCGTARTRMMEWKEALNTPKQNQPT